MIGYDIRIPDDNTARTVIVSDSANLSKTTFKTPYTHIHES